MGFNIKRFLRSPGKSIAKVIADPADALLGDDLRRSNLYKFGVRAPINIGAGALSGFAASGGNPLGALAGGVTSLAQNPTKGFQLKKDVLLPGLAGGVTGLADAGIEALGEGGFDLGSILGGAREGATSAFPGGGFADSGAGINLGGFTLPDIGDIPGGFDLSNAGQLLGLGLSTFGGQEHVPGSATVQQRGQALARAEQLGDPEFIRQQASDIRADPNTQALLTDLRTRVAEQVRGEYMSTVGRHLSQTGGFGSSQQQQLEQQMAADLTSRLARAENDLVMQILNQQLGTNISAAQLMLGEDIGTQPTTTSNIGSALLGIL